MNLYLNYVFLVALKTNEDTEAIVSANILYIARYKDRSETQ